MKQFKRFEKAYDYQFKLNQVKEQLKAIKSLSEDEVDSIAIMAKKNLEEGTRTLLSTSKSAVVSFQLDVGLAFKGKLDKGFEKSDAIYLITTDKDNTFKVKVTKISYKLAKRKANELDLPAKKYIVQNLIWNQKGKVAINKYNIHQYKEEFLAKGNQVMANLIERAIANNEF